MDAKVLIEFVDRIEMRKGMASIEEIFVEMITIAQYFLQMENYDRHTQNIGESSMKPNRQLEKMWVDLKTLANHYKKNKDVQLDFVGCYHSDDVCPCGRGNVYFSPIFKFDVCFECMYERSKATPPRWGVTTKCRICKVGPRICTDKTGRLKKMIAYCSYCNSNMMKRYQSKLTGPHVTDKPCCSCRIRPRYTTPKGSQKSQCWECRRKSQSDYNRMRYAEIKNRSQYKPSSDSE